MCGVYGFVGDGAREIEPRLSRMGDSLAHRGPDDEGVWIEPGIVLGHRRLKIIDLSDCAAQPMVSQNGRYVISYNGEVYNYVELRAELQVAAVGSFRSSSDTEVLLEAWATWGAGCLDRINGMFAFALWDRWERQLWLVRDRVGIKPMYYWPGPDGLLFGSEVKALLASGLVAGQIDSQGIAEYLKAGHPVSDRTWFSNILALKPGHLLVHSANGISRRAWWRWSAVPDRRLADPGAAVEELESVLYDAVRIHTRSDVPVGCHLSGGIDSSTVVGIARQQLPERLHTFSGWFAEGEEYDERKYVHAVRDLWSTDHHEIRPQWQQFRDEIGYLLRLYDFPTNAAPGFSQLKVCELARKDVTVVLGGQGGDELFAGYYRHILAHLRDSLQRPSLQGYSSLDMLGLLLGAGRHAREIGLPGLREKLERPGTIHSVLTPAWRDRVAAVPGLDSTDDHDRMTAQLRWDLERYLPGLMHVEDRTSMAYSLESRVPLLDVRLLDLAGRIPSRVKLWKMTPKYPLRAAAREYLPRIVANRSDKKGFPTPLGRWLAGPLYEWARSLLVRANPLSRQIFDTTEVDKLLSGNRKGRDVSMVLWRVLTVELWLREWFPDAGSA